MRQFAGDTASFDEAWLVVGRRGGKSRIMSLVAMYLTVCRTYKLARGETGLFMVLAKDKRRARVVKRYTEALLLAVPEFAAQIDGDPKMDRSRGVGTVLVDLTGNGGGTEW